MRQAKFQQMHYCYIFKVIYKKDFFSPRYMDNVEVLVEEPVKMKRYQWCVGVPPRCTSYTTELKNRTKIEVMFNNENRYKTMKRFWLKELLVNSRILSLWN